MKRFRAGLPEIRTVFVRETSARLPWLFLPLASLHVPAGTARTSCFPSPSSIHSGWAQPEEGKGRMYRGVGTKRPSLFRSLLLSPTALGVLPTSLQDLRRSLWWVTSGVGYSTQGLCLPGQRLLSALTGQMTLMFANLSLFSLCFISLANQFFLFFSRAECQTPTLNSAFYLAYQCPSVQMQIS